MGYALLGLVIGALLGLTTQNPAAMILTSVVGLTLGIAAGRGRRETRREAAEVKEAAARSRALREGIRTHLVGAARRGLIDSATLERLLADLDRAPPPAVPSAPAVRSGSEAPPALETDAPGHRASAPMGARNRPDPVAYAQYTIPQGTPLWLVSKRGPWALVRLLDGSTAWVTGSLVEEVPPPGRPAPPDIPAEAPPSGPPASPIERVQPPVAGPAPQRESPVRPAPPVPPRTARPAPAPPAQQPPSRLAISFERLSGAAGRAWRAFTADIAIHTLTYVGVLLLIVVMFVFFAFGYYGDMVAGDQWRPWRPAVTLGIPVVLFGIAWLLRTRTGIPFTANAISLVAALSLPIMLSALFQDGAPWGPPDVDGPARWLAYGAVGVVIVGVYWVAARRAAIYGYLVGPGIWTAVGALALYLERGIDLLGDPGVTFASFEGSDGISGLQMAAVVGAIAVTVPIASMFRKSEFGRAVALRTVRAAVVSLPVMACLAVVFAFSDARVRGIARPTLSDIGGVAVATMALAGAAMLWIRRAEYAGEGFGPRVRQFMSDALAGVGHLCLVVAWLLGIGVGLAPGWAGVGLVAYAVVLAAWGTLVGLTPPAALWGSRVAAAAGLALALDDPVTTIVAWGSLAGAAVVAELVPGAGERFRRSLGMGGHVLTRLGLVVLPYAVVVFGVTRLVPDAAASWVVLSGGAALVGCRWMPGLVLPMAAGSPAGAAVLTAVGLEMGRTASLAGGPDGADTIPLGILLLAASVVSCLLRVPVEARFPVVAVMATAGAALVLRELAADPVVADAGVAALAGTGLTFAAAVGHRSSWSMVADVLGHLGAYASLGIAASGDSRTAVVAALGAVVAVHGLGAWAADRHRSPLGTGAASMVNAVVQGVVASVAIPVLAAVAADAFTWIRSEPPRAGLVLAAVAWIYLAGLTGIEATSLRRVMTIGAYLVAAAGIAVTAISLPASILSVWSAAAATGLIAWFEHRPALSAPSWILGVTATVLTAARAGLGQGDLHFVIFGAGAALAIAPVVVGRRDRLGSRWLHPPVALGLLLLPVGVGFAIADRRLLAVLALTAAAAYAAIGWLLRFGGFSVPAAAMVGIAYAHLMEGWVNPFDKPLAWMPLAAAFAVGGMLLPGRSFTRGDIGFGLVVGWWATALLAVVIGLREGQLDWTLLVDAALLSGYGLVVRSPWFGYVGLALFGVAGALFGPGWLALALLGMAVAVAGHAYLRDDRIARHVLAPTALVLGAGSFVALGFWQEWTAGEAVGYGLSAAVLAGTAAGIASLIETPSRVGMWVFPVQVLAQAGLTALTVAALLRMGDGPVGWEWAGFSVPEARLVLAAVLGFDAALVGVAATVLRLGEWVWVSVGLAAGAVGMLLAWADPTPGTLVPMLMTLGVVVVAIAAAVTLGSPPTRVGLWGWPLQALGQASLVVAAIVAVVRISGGPVDWSWDGLSSGDAELALAGLLAMEAALVGVTATMVRRWVACWVSVTLVAGSIAMIGVWAAWEPGTVVIVAGTAGVGLAVLGAVAGRVRLPNRAEMWVLPIEALGQFGLLVASMVAVFRLAAGAVSTDWPGLSMGAAQLTLAGVLAFEAVLVGAIGTVERRDEWPWASMTLAAGSMGMLLAWFDPTPGDLVVVLLVAGGTVAAAGGWAMLAGLPERAAMWAGPIEGLGQVSLVAAGWVSVMRIDDSGGTWAGLSVGEAQLVVAVALGLEAALVGVIGTLRCRFAAPWAAMVLAAGSYAMFGVWASWGPDVAWVASAVPGALLALGTLGLALRRTGGWLEMWVAPLHGLGQAGLVISGFIAFGAFAASGAFAGWAGLLGFEAALVVLATPLLPKGLRSREAAAGLAAASLLCGFGSVQSDTGRVIASQAIAVLGAAALITAEDLRRLRPEWFRASWVFGVGAVAGSAILTASVLGPVLGATAGAMAIGGAGLVAGGLRSGWWPIAYVGMIMDLGAALIAGRNVLNGSRHGYAISIAVVLLIILDMEHVRTAGLEDPPRPDRLALIPTAELVVAGVPLVMAAVDALGKVGYAGLLAVEAVAIVLWAIASRVKRRLLVGALALVAAILIPAVVLSIEAGSGGISTGAVLGIAAAVAVVFIVVGSLLERGRARVGLAVRRISEILEEWE